MGALCRLVHAAIDLDLGAPVEQRSAAEGALVLAIRLGIKVPAMLDTLLSAESGAAFYEASSANLVVRLSGSVLWV